MEDEKKNAKVVDLKGNPVKIIDRIPLNPLVQEIFKDNVHTYNEANERLVMLIRTIISQAGATGVFALSQDGTALVRQEQDTPAKDVNDNAKDSTNAT